MRLDRNWIELNIPHHGRMCLLEEVVVWDAHHIRCRSGTHRAADHPLRSRGRLGIACGIEYAAQAMAVHGALTGGASLGGAAAALAGAEAGTADASLAPSQAGFLAGLRNVRMQVLSLDDIESDLICEAELLAGDRGSALYEFAVKAAALTLLSGRATVIFHTDNRLQQS